MGSCNLLELKTGNMKSTIVLLLFFVGVAYSSCPGCYSEADINNVPEIEEIKNIASATSTKLIAGNSDGNCRENNGRQTTCKNFRIFRDLPFRCPGSGSCLKLISKEEEITCKTE